MGDRHVVFYNMLEVSAVRLHACTKTLATLVNCIVNNALVDVTPHVLYTLFQFVSVVQPRHVHSLLDDAPDSVINRLFAGQRYHKGVECTGDGHERPLCSSSSTVSYLQRIFNKNQKLMQIICMLLMCTKTKCVQKSNFLVCICFKICNKFELLNFPR